MRRNIYISKETELSMKDLGAPVPFSYLFKEIIEGAYLKKHQARLRRVMPTEAPGFPEVKELGGRLVFDEDNLLYDVTNADLDEIGADVAALDWYDEQRDKWNSTA